MYRAHLGFIDQTLNFEHLELDPDMHGVLVLQAAPLCECTCSTYSISSSSLDPRPFWPREARRVWGPDYSSSGRVRVAGGHAATKHQLANASGRLYCVQRDCATLII